MMLEERKGLENDVVGDFRSWHIDIPSGHVCWMYHDLKKGWQFFASHDSETVERAWVEMVQQRLDKCDDVFVEQGRYQVTVMQRRMQPVYWEGKSLQVCRGTWIFANKKNEFTPFEERDSHFLEESWRQRQEVCNQNNKSLFCSVPMYDNIDKKESKLYAKGIGSILSETSESKDEVFFTEVEKVVPKYHGVCSIYRGHVYTINENTQMVPRHLAFVVHGIGEYYCKKEDNALTTIYESTDGLRKISRDINHTRFLDTEGFVEYIPIDWTAAVRDEENLLQDISLGSLQLVRQLTNEILSDVLFYMARQQEIIHCVVNQMNEAYRKFKENHQAFCGTISILGHSLGSVISYDLLRHQTGSFSDHKGISFGQLTFNLNAFFAFGSPVALFEAVKGKRLEKNARLPTCPKLFNVYHPMDPVAYRLEPLLCKSFKDRHAVRVPRYEGSDRIHYVLTDLGEKIQEESRELAQTVNTALNHFMQSIGRGGLDPRKGADVEVSTHVPNDLNSSLSLVSKEETMEDLGFLNDGERIDHELQSTPFEHLHQLPAALWAHSSYWESKDFVAFVVTQMRRLHETS